VIPSSGQAMFVAFGRLSASARHIGVASAPMKKIKQSTGLDSLAELISLLS
jgi:hypothetical protein